MREDRVEANPFNLEDFSGEREVRKRVTICTLLSFHHDKFFPVRNNGSPVITILTSEEERQIEISVALFPEPQGWERHFLLWDREDVDEFRLREYELIRMLDLNFIKDSLNLPDETLDGISSDVKELMLSDPSGVSWLKYSLDRCERKALEHQNNASDYSEAVIKYGSVDGFLAEVINPEAELRDEKPSWILPPKPATSPSDVPIILLTENIVHKFPPNIRKTVLMDIIRDETSYMMGRDGKVRSVPALKAEAVKLFYSIYKGRIDHFLVFQEMEGKV